MEFRLHGGRSDGGGGGGGTLTWEATVRQGNWLFRDTDQEETSWHKRAWHTTEESVRAQQQAPWGAMSTSKPGSLQ